MKYLAQGLLQLSASWTRSPTDLTFIELIVLEGRVIHILLQMASWGLWCSCRHCIRGYQGLRCRGIGLLGAEATRSTFP